MPVNSDRPFPCRTFLGLDVCVATRREAMSFLLARLAARQRTRVAFANANLLHVASETAIADEISRQFVVFNDGVALDLISRACYGQPFPDNLNGTDLTADLLAGLPSGTRVFLFGARPEVTARAAATLESRYGVAVAGCCDGYVGEAEAAGLAERINASGADVVLVALGNPRQEQWILRQARRLEAPLVLAVGAFLDFAANAVPRAPAWLRALRLEWLFRLAREPSRLWRRYTVEGALLAVKIARDRRRTAARTSS